MKKTLEETDNQKKSLIKINQNQKKFLIIIFQSIICFIKSKKYIKFTMKKK